VELGCGCNTRVCYNLRGGVLSQVTRMWFSLVACPRVLGSGAVWHRSVTLVSPILCLLCSLLRYLHNHP
jgi:hypothetical protein